jgi:hypothetical protein
VFRGFNGLTPGQSKSYKWVAVRQADAAEADC